MLLARAPEPFNSKLAKLFEVEKEITRIKIKENFLALCNRFIILLLMFEKLIIFYTEFYDCKKYYWSLT